MFEFFFTILNFLRTFHIFLQTLNGKWRLIIQSVFWLSVGLVSLYFCDIWESYLKDKIPSDFIQLVSAGFNYHVALFIIVLLIMPTVSSINSGLFRRHKHIKKLLKCFLEMFVVWFTTLLKAKISKGDIKEGQIALFILAISIYFILVILMELVFLTKDFGLINATASVIVLLLIMGGLGFWAVPISTIVVFLKTIMMAECYEECRERRKIKRELEEDAHLEWLKLLCADISSFDGHLH